MKKRLIPYAILIFICLIYILISSPNLNPLYSEGALFWCSVITVVIVISQMETFLKDFFSSINNLLFQRHQDTVIINDKVKIKKYAIIILICLWGGYLSIHIGSSVIFNSKAYRNQLSEPTVKKFTSDIQAVDINQIPIVDKSLAYKLADKKLGEKPSLGSQVRLGEPVIQKVQGYLVWIVPLHHSGFLKWLTNMHGTLGYIVVSATNTQNIKYVDNYKIKYHPNSYFFDDLLRKVRLSKALFTGITDYSFELDDNGRPYWVLTTYKNLRGFNLPEATGVITLDAETGKISKYSLDNIPDWVDRVQPEEFIIQQINNKGTYIHGIFNFSNKDKFKISKGYIIVYSNDRCYLFTGITNVGIDGSATGFYMVDMITKEPILYRISGATEYSAMSSAEGKVQDLGYKASSPIILNINNIPTYFITLKDNEGLIKKYSYVSVKDYGIVGVGDTVKEANENYIKSLKEAGIIDNININDENKKLANGRILRIGFTIVDNKTLYNFILDSMPETVFSFNYDKNSNISLSKEGDIVTVEYIDNNNDISVITFENETIKNKK